MDSEDNVVIQGKKEEQSVGNPGNQKPSNDIDSPPAVFLPKAPIKAEISAKHLEIILSDKSDRYTDIIANNDYHAFFIKDEATGDCLDKFNANTASIRGTDHFRNISDSGQGDSLGLYLPLVERLRHKKNGTKVLFTDKRKIPANLHIYARRLIGNISRIPRISDADRKLIQVAGEIYNLSKLQHPVRARTRFQEMAAINTRFISLLKEHPDLVGILRSIYCRPRLAKGQEPSLPMVGASVLGITDLLVENTNLDRPLTGEELLLLSQSLRALTSDLFLKEVVESAITALEDQIMPSAGQDFNHVAIFSDRPVTLFAIEKRLKSHGFRVSVADNLDSFVTIYRENHPGIVILWLHFSPGEIVRVLQSLSRHRININALPAFLLVKGNVVGHLNSIIDLDSVDILDLESSPDVLVFKIAKIREKSQVSSGSGDLNGGGHSGSSGNLKDMNLIDLIQAMGPGKRTARIEITPEDKPSEKLTLYLSQGNIIYASLGSLLGEMAIYRALSWENGTWEVEKVGEGDLPEPNNDRPNEFILMEGCRLMDEKSEPA